MQLSHRSSAVYEVECKEAALGEVSQQWLEVTTWSLEVEDAPAGATIMSSSCPRHVVIPTLCPEATALLEPEVIFKLSRVVVRVNIVTSAEIVHDIPSERCGANKMCR